MPQSTADGMVVRTGKVFECGTYEDKDFSFDETDLMRAVEQFEPVPVDMEHTASVLDGKLGHVARIFPGEDGASLMGEVHLPQWLDSLLEDGQRKVSATWDRATKTLRGLALVRDPRVSDAALMAAFSAASDGQDKPDVKTVSYGTYDFHGTSTGNQPRQRSLKHMDIKSWLLGKAQEEGVEIDGAELEAAFNRQPDPKVGELETSLKAKDAEIEALRKQQQEHAAQFARAAQERREAEAVTFASRQIQAHRITPASQEKLAALHARVTAADSTAQFADGEKPTSVLLQEFIDSLPDLKAFTTEHIRREEVAALFNEMKTEGVDGKPTEARADVVDRILGATPDGRAILAERAKNGSK